MKWQENNLLFELEVFENCKVENTNFIKETVIKPIRQWINLNCFELDISNSYNARQGYI